MEEPDRKLLIDSLIKKMMDMTREYQVLLRNDASYGERKELRVQMRNIQNEINDLERNE